MAEEAMVQGTEEKELAAESVDGRRRPETAGAEASGECGAEGRAGAGARRAGPVAGPAGAAAGGV